MAVAQGSIVMNDATRFIRAVRKLNKLLMRYSYESLAKALVDRGIKRDLVQSTGEILDGVWRLMPKDPRTTPKCVVCGDEDGIVRPGMSDTLTRAGSLYCSHKCRQKAYRDRIRDAKTTRIGRPRVTQSRSVTGKAPISEQQPSRAEVRP
jgi:hypothetical protein